MKHVSRVRLDGRDAVIFYREWWAVRRRVPLAQCRQELSQLFPQSNERTRTAEQGRRNGERILRWLEKRSDTIRRAWYG